MSIGMLKIVEGDVTNPVTTHEDEIAIIPHCCNNLGVMGAGVALALRKKWGVVFNAYTDMKKKVFGPDKYMLGGISSVPVVFVPNTTIPKIVVVNMIGQDGTVSADNPKPVKYWALQKCMEKTRELVLRNNSKGKPVIHCPKFGSDLAGGDWNFILEIIREQWLDYGIDVVVYEFVPENMINRKKKPLYRTDVVIWTEENVFHQTRGYGSLADLAREAEQGDAYCSRRDCAIVEDIYGEDEYDALNSFFFGMDEEE